MQDLFANLCWHSFGFSPFCILPSFFGLRCLLVCVLFCIERSATQPVSPQMFHEGGERQRCRVDSGWSGILQAPAPTVHNWVCHIAAEPDTQVGLGLL